MNDLTQYADTLRGFEKKTEDYVRKDPVTVAREEANRGVAQFNQWQARTTAEIRAAGAKVDEQFEIFRGLDRRVKEFDQRLASIKPEPGDSAAILAYNRLAEERNKLVEEQRVQARACEELRRQHNEAVQAFNDEQARRHSALGTLQKDCQGKVDAFVQWRNDRGLEQLFTDLTRFIATLRQQLRSPTDDAPSLAPLLDQARALRHELGQSSQRRQEQTEHGLLIVRAILGDAEESYLVVDAAATVTSITEEMVDVLGIRELIGEEVELMLPHAIRVKVRQVLIPRIALGGDEAQFVKAVVLKESMPGVDGCLGLSFLNRFDYRIERERGQPPKLRLERLADVRPDAGFDVFICHKQPEDYDVAKQVFDVLTAAGHRPFLSEECQPDSPGNEIQKAVDHALLSAKHLAVICSSADYLTRPWIEAEWGQFEWLKRSGKKQGKVLPILCGEMTDQQLPAALGRYGAISLKDPNWQSKLVRFLPPG